MTRFIHTLSSLAASIVALICGGEALAAPPPFSDYCERLQQEIQGKKHGFLAGNAAYYVGGFHASWELKEHETLGLTHPFYHDLRSRGVGLIKSRGTGHNDTGTGNDYSGWEFYKDTRVLYGSVVVDGATHTYPIPRRMYWRPDRMICEYEVDGVQLREEKFIAGSDVACSIIKASRPITLRFDGRSFFGRHSLTSTATIRYDKDHNAIHIVEGGTTGSRPETDRSERTGPIMYEGMSTVLAASRDFSNKHRFQKGTRGEWKYEFEIPCDSTGVALVWAMHDERGEALKMASAVMQQPRDALLTKTQEMNRQLNEAIPWFRCSDRKFEDIYYYLWSLYLMYYIDVQKGWEAEPHTQTAVNNFLGMHRYDATFQIKVGAWTGDKRHFAYGNVLTWKHLFVNGHYRKSPDGGVALSDNKGTSWHSGAYGNELSEHVLGAWQIYEHSGDVEFLRDCYEGYFREVFRERISPFFSNHFEVAEALTRMARLTGHANDVEHWQNLVARERDQIATWFDQRWETNNHADFFAGPKTGMLMTTGFWHMRSRHFPRDYAVRMTESWALDRNKGFFGAFFPLAMSRQSMAAFSSQSDNAFGYTPDTAYFTLSGMFQQRLGDSAWRLTINHLENYNFSSDWNVPIAPEAYRRDRTLFGDQYSNFNAGKLLLFLEGLAGLEYSIPRNRLVVHDTMPPTWKWMEVRLPIQLRERNKTDWPAIRFERTQTDTEVSKLIRISDCPLRITIEPWSEGKRVTNVETTPPRNESATKSRFPHYHTHVFRDGQTEAAVKLHLSNHP